LILLSDDRGNREIAQAEGLIAISTREYVDGLESDEREKLVDLVVGGVDEVAPSERRAKRIYQEVRVDFSLLDWMLTASTFLKMSSLPESRVADFSKDTTMPTSTTTSR